MGDYSKVFKSSKIIAYTNEMMKDEKLNNKYKKELLDSWAWKLEKNIYENGVLHSSELSEINLSISHIKECKDRLK